MISWQAWLPSTWMFLPQRSPLRRTGKSPLSLEHLEERNLLAASIPNALFYAVSDDGRFSIYSPIPSFLLATGGPQSAPLFLHDEDGVNGATDQQLADAISDPLQGNAKPTLSHDGNFVAYQAPDPSTGLSQIFVIQVNKQDIRNSSSAHLVSHASNSTNGANGDSTNPVLASTGASSATLAFVSSADDLPGQNGNPTHIANIYRSTVTFATNVTDSTVLVSHDGTGAQTVADSDSSNPSISDNGQFIAYQSQATNLLPAGGSISGSNIYLFSTTQETALVSHAVGSTTTSTNGDSTSPAISRDGSAVAYVSAGTVVANQSGPANVNNVFLYTRADTNNTQVSRHLGSGNTSATPDSDSPVLNSNGSLVAYRSDAADLVAGVTDNNNQSDIFQYSGATQQSMLVSSSASNLTQTANGSSTTPVTDPTGRYVAYSSSATNLVPNETASGNLNIYRWFRPGATNLLLTGKVDANGRQSLTDAQTDGNATNPVIDQTGAVLFTLQVITQTQAGQLATLTGISPDLAIVLTLGPLTIANGTPPGTVATMSTSVLINNQPAVGQLISPDYSLVPGNGAEDADNGAFAIAGPTDVATGSNGLKSLFTANGNIKGSYRIRLQTFAHIGDPVAQDFVLTVPSSTPIPQPTARSTQVGAVDPATNTWYLNVGAAVISFPFGVPGWTPVTGDWTGSGPTQIGVVDPASNTWYLNTTSGVISFPFGLPGWKPVTGDWTGTGSTQVGVVDPATNTWYLNTTSGVISFPFGLPGWIPVSGDWTGTGRTQVGVVDPATSTWYLNTNSGVISFPYGLPGWKPITGDWTGSGSTQVGMVDPVSNTWYLNSASGVISFPFGAPGWTPVSGDWNGPTQALHASSQTQPDASNILSTSQLQDLVAASLTRLSAAGVDPTVVQRLASAQYLVGALPGTELGLAAPLANRVIINSTAAGHGWFIDPTPLSDEEFTLREPNSPLVALAGSAAQDKEDLLTTVLHEMGHLAGLPDRSNGSSADLMAEMLATGERRTEALDAVFAAR